MSNGAFGFEFEFESDDSKDLSEWLIRGDRIVLGGTESKIMMSSLFLFPIPLS